MVNKKLVITNVLMWGILILIAYFGEAVQLFAYNYSSKIAPLDHYIFFAAIAITLVVYFILERKSKNLRPSYLFVTLLILFAGINIFTVAMIPFEEIVSIYSKEGVQVDVIITHSANDLTEAILRIILIAVSVYFVLIVIPRKFYSIHQYRYFFVAFIGLVLLSYAYSLIFEFDKYVEIIRTLDFFNSEHAPSSVFVNVNIFGFFSLLGFLATVFLYMRRKRFYYHLLLPIFVLFCLFSSSYICLFLTVCSYILFYAGLFFLNFKHHFKAHIIALFIFIIIIVGAILSLVMCYLFIEEVHYNFDLFFQYVRINVFDNGRINIWRQALDLLSNPYYLFFGRGVDYYQQYMSIPEQMTHTMYSHNGFIEVLGQSGIIGFAFYVLICLYLIYIIFRLFHIDKRIAYYTLMSFIIINMHSCFETTYFFELSSKGLAISIMIFAPAISVYYRARHQEDINEFKYYKLQPAMPIEPLSNLKSIGSCFSLFFLSISGFILGSTPQFMQYNLFPSSIFLFLALFITGLTIPYVVYVYLSIAKRCKANLSFIIIYLLLIFIGLPLTYLLPTRFVATFIYSLIVNIIFLIGASFTRYRKMENTRIISYFIDNLFLPLIPFALSAIITISLYEGLNLSSWTGFFGVMILSNFTSIASFLFLKPLGKGYHVRFYGLMYTLSFKILKTYLKQIRCEESMKMKKNKIKKMKKPMLAEFY